MFSTRSPQGYISHDQHHVPLDAQQPHIGSARTDIRALSSTRHTVSGLLGVARNHKKRTFLAVLLTSLVIVAAVLLPGYIKAKNEVEPAASNKKGMAFGEVTTSSQGYYDGESQEGEPTSSNTELWISRMATTAAPIDDRDMEMTTTTATEVSSSETASSTSFTPVPASFLFSTSEESKVITIEINTDDFGDDTSWTLESIPNGTTIAESQETYADNEQYLHEVDVPDGNDFIFTIYDTVGDGICCEYSEGSYAISVDGIEILRGGRFGEEISHIIRVGYDPKPEMDAVDIEWLQAHNERRRDFHESNGVYYVPLQWSNALKGEAMSWVNQLLEDCTAPYKEPGVQDGQNMFGKGGQGLETPEEILVRWVDNLADDGYPENQPLTQVYWRASNYLGCASGSKVSEVGGPSCERHVCRYVTTGNCQMGNYNSKEGDNWMIPTLLNHSICGSICPDDGCYYSTFDGTPTAEPTSSVPMTGKPTSPDITTPEPSTGEPTFKPTRKPTKFPTKNPSQSPTRDPTYEPSFVPSNEVSSSPSSQPSEKPTTQQPTTPPINEPSDIPTYLPTSSPSLQPSMSPSISQLSFTSSSAAASTTTTGFSSTSATEFSSTSSTFVFGKSEASKVVTIEINTDGHGEETSWVLESIPTGTTVASSQITYSNNEQYVEEVDLPEADYLFTVYDSYGDGMCCQSSEGSYTVFVDGVEILHGGRFGEEISHIIRVGYDPEPEMEAADIDWLRAHNERRREFHESNDATYIPLQWSNALKDQAMSWVNELLLNCSAALPEPGVQDGQNMFGSSGNGNGDLETPEQVLVRWVDNKENLGYPDNSPLTQVYWRASKHLGCASGLKFVEGTNKFCERHVCRYVTTGNCQMGIYNSKEGNNWMVPTLMDHSPCGNICPDDGCYYSDFDGTPEPTNEPTSKPSSSPSAQPSKALSQAPSYLPSVEPSSSPSKKPTKKPTRKPTPPPTELVTNQPMQSPPSTTTVAATVSSSYTIMTVPSSTTLLPISTAIFGASETGKLVSIEINTDINGEETSWTLETIPDGTTIASSQESYSSEEQYVHSVEVQPNDYLFTIYDSTGNGLCCNGSYAVYVDEIEILRGSRFGDEESHVIRVGYDPEPEMDDVDVEWLEAHNKRRLQFHESNNVSYVPLHWSKELKDQAMLWLNQLLEDCSTLLPEPNIAEGENIYGQQGQGIGNALETPEEILVRWVDDKFDENHPSNSALTQVHWRASHYLGCASGSKVSEDSSSFCERHVCRYVTAGNCNMGAYNSSVDDNWKIPTLMDYSPCGYICPKDGCYYSDFDGVQPASGPSKGPETTLTIFPSTSPTQVDILDTIATAGPSSSLFPTQSPSEQPSLMPTMSSLPSSIPSNFPTHVPSSSSVPSIQPSLTSAPSNPPSPTPTITPDPSSALSSTPSVSETSLFPTAPDVAQSSPQPSSPDQDGISRVIDSSSSSFHSTNTIILCFLASILYSGTLAW